MKTKRTSRRRRPIPRGPAFVACAMCTGGWLTIASDVGSWVQRCHCWRVHQAKLYEVRTSGEVSR